MRKILLVFFILLYIGLISVGDIIKPKYYYEDKYLNEYWKVDEEMQLKDALIKFTNQNQNSAYQVKYFSSRIISFKVDYLHRTPNTYRTVDMKTGKDIFLTDVFRCKRYKEMLSNYIVKNYGDKIDEELISDNQYFFTEDGLVIVVGEEDIHKYTIPKEIIGRKFKSRGKEKYFKKFLKVN